MKLIQSKKFESNYWAKVVNITSFNLVTSGFG